MSWTVQQEDTTPTRERRQGGHHNDSHDSDLEELLQQVVDDDENEDMRPARTNPFSPAPLTPGELATPIKGQGDPLDNFNTWMRGQTPNSNRASPTPTGSNYLVSGGNTPASGTRGPHPGYGSNASMTTPSKNGGRWDVDSPSAQQRGMPPKDLHLIKEQQRLLRQEMEKLQMAEMELCGGRQSPSGHGGMNQQNMPGYMSEYEMANGGLNPFAASFGNPTHQHLTAENIRGRVYETAKDQHGCRFLQRALDSNYDSDIAHVIMNEIVPYVPELMTDQYANFLVQKLFDIMPHDVRFNVAKVAAPQMPQIALTAHGTFSVQKLIETITTREEMVVVRDALSGDVVQLVMDVHGNHVIQKVLQRFDHPDKQFIYDAVAMDCVNIAMNKQGCCVLQRCLEFASPEQHASLVTTVLDSALNIVQDPFGNYVLQYVLETDDVSVNDRIGYLFLGHLIALGVNKFSSNVLEKVLRRSSQALKDKYCEGLSDPQTAARLVSDDFGNYVVQTALTTGSPGAVDGLVQTIRPLMHMIRNAPYAKKLESKLEIIAKKGQMGGMHKGGGPMSPNRMYGNAQRPQVMPHYGNDSGSNSGGSPMNFTEYNANAQPFLPQGRGMPPSNSASSFSNPSLASIGSPSPHARQHQQQQQQQQHAPNGNVSVAVAPKPHVNSPYAASPAQPIPQPQPRNGRDPTAAAIGGYADKTRVVPKEESPKKDSGKTTPQPEADDSARGRGGVWNGRGAGVARGAGGRGGGARGAGGARRGQR